METRPASQPASTEAAKKLAPSVGREKDKKVFAVTILKDQKEVYDFWRDLENFTLFMKDVEEIDILSREDSRWHLKLKSGVRIEWHAHIIEDIPGQMISWASREGSAVQVGGTVWFEKAPAGRGTIVKLSLSYKIPGGKISELAALFTGEDPNNLVLTNLRRLKAYLETGVIATTEGQPSGRKKESDASEHLH